MSSTAADAILKALGKSGGLVPVVNRPMPIATFPDEQPVAACEPEQQDQQPQSDGVADDRVDIVDAEPVDDQIEESSVIAAALADASETERIAALDRVRCEIDRAAQRGYDFDPTAPSHAEFIARQNGEPTGAVEVEAPAIVNPGELKPGELPTTAMVAAWRNDPRVPVQVAEDLRRWEQQLVLMGWSLERIWRPTFWPHSDEHPRGLAATLNADDRIILADCAHIWITNRAGQQRKLPKKV